MRTMQSKVMEFSFPGIWNGCCQSTREPEPHYFTLTLNEHTENASGGNFNNTCQNLFSRSCKLFEIKNKLCSRHRICIACTPWKIIKISFQLNFLRVQNLTCSVGKHARACRPKTLTTQQQEKILEVTIEEVINGHSDQVSQCCCFQIFPGTVPTVSYLHKWFISRCIGHPYQPISLGSSC